jgi:hypothetical protein
MVGTMAKAGIPLPSSITFHYVKSQHFRVVHSDGILGGMTPRGLIHYVVFSERQAIPQSMTQSVGPDGRLGAVTGSAGKEGIVREMEVDVIMDRQNAKTFHEWLGERLAELEATQPEAKKSGD